MRVLVGGDDLRRRPAATRSARRSPPASTRQRVDAAPGRAPGRAASRPARVASPRGHQQAVDAVRARRRGSRRCRRRRPACPRRTPPSAPSRSDSPPSDGAHSTSASRSAALLRRVVDAAERGHAVAVDEQRRQFLGVEPMTVSSAGTSPRSASKARSSTGRPLRSTAWPTKAIRSGSPGARRRGAGSAAVGHDDAVGDDPVAAAVEAPAGPGGGLGDRDPDVQAVELAPRARAARRPCAAATDSE